MVQYRLISMKQKQQTSLYLSYPVRFRKESETINAVIKDKQIKSKKKNIIGLLKAHAEVTEDLLENGQLFEKERAIYDNTNSILKTAEAAIKKDLLKTMIRKTRLQAIEDPSIREDIGSKLKDYLLSWALFKKYQFIRDIGGVHNYRVAKKSVWKMELAFYALLRIDRIILLKHCTIFNENCKLQNILICVRRLNRLEQESEQALAFQFKLEIYSTSGEYFFMHRYITEKQLQSKLLKSDEYLANIETIKTKRSNQIMRPDNPLRNLVVFIRKKMLMFIDEYFATEENRNKIERALKICKFQMDVLRQKKKHVFFKCLRISNIFESVYGVSGYENAEIDVLFAIKKEEISAQIEFDEHVNSNQVIRNQYRGEESSHNSIKYTLICEPVKSYPSKLMFVIRDSQLLQDYINCLPVFLQIFLAKYLIQLDAKKLVNRIEMTANNSKQSDKSSRNALKYEKQDIKPQIVKRINFSRIENLTKVIKAQSAIRMNLQRRRYISDLAIAKKNLTFDFCSKIQGNIIISAYIQRSQLIYFVECLSLSAEKTKKQQTDFLKYDKKYWKLALQFISSQECAEISRKYLVWEIEEDIALCFEDHIKKYEEQQEKINQMKPVHAFNRLRRLFIRAVLKSKVRRNILCVKKIQTQFATLALILRRSPWLKNIVEAHLYVLQLKENSENIRQPHIKTQTKIYPEQKAWTNKKNDLSMDYEIVSMARIASGNSSFKYVIEPNSKIKYLKICMYRDKAHKFVEYMSNIVKLKDSAKEQCKDVPWTVKNKSNAKCVENQFYITETDFVLKPLHEQFINGEYRFVERLSFINITKQENANDMLNTSSYHKNGRLNESQLCKSRSRQKSFNTQVKKSSDSIPLDKSLTQPTQKVIEESVLVFYSLYRLTSGANFFIELFMLSTGASNKYFKSVHKEQISKKELANSEWTFAQKFILSWSRRSERINKLTMKQDRLNQEQSPHRYRNLNRGMPNIEKTGLLRQQNCSRNEQERLQL